MIVYSGMYLKKQSAKYARTYQICVINMPKLSNISDGVFCKKNSALVTEIFQDMRGD